MGRARVVPVLGKMSQLSVVGDLGDVPCPAGGFWGVVDNFQSRALSFTESHSPGFEADRQQLAGCVRGCGWGSLWKQPAELESWTHGCFSSRGWRPLPAQSTAPWCAAGHE